MSTFEAPSSTQFDSRSQHYQALKGRIHQELLNRLNPLPKSWYPPTMKSR